MATIQPTVPAPAMDLPLLDGEFFKLTNRLGKFTIINFWALWCEPCKAEMPALGRLRQKLEKFDVDVVAVNLGDRPVGIRRFARTYDIGQLPIVLDASSQSNTNWRLQGLPATFVIGPNGSITHAAFGARMWDHTSSLKWLLKEFQLD